MIRHSKLFHGSDLETIEEIYGIKKENIINFAQMAILWVFHQGLRRAYVNILIP